MLSEIENLVTVQTLEMERTSVCIELECDEEAPC